ncbi:MAG TPA: DNA alkylation repair protein, partial [Egibacteraceae bacterium]|nr:DNA alkylation repair protein [Egibacteraceae bacterium]
MDVVATTDALVQRLREQGTAERAVHEKAYLRSDLMFLGASVPAIRRAAQELIDAHRPLSHDELVAVVEHLWRREVHECRMAAVELLAARLDLVGPDDVTLLERLLRESRTWALVDGLSVSVVGTLVRRGGVDGTVLDRWAGDDDFWIRRAALLALLPGIRAGAGDLE